MCQEEVKIIEVTNETTHEQVVVRNLLKLYCYEWSQYNLIDVNDDGSYEFEQHASAYWTYENHHAFLVKVNGYWAGFAIIDQDFLVHKDYDYSMAEFFIMHKYRCNGLGQYVANYIFVQFPGKWEIGRNPKNIVSVKFWDHVINDYTNGHYETIYSCPEHKYFDGTLGDVLSFEKEKHEREHE